MDGQDELFPGHVSARGAAAAGIETAVRNANLQSDRWSDRARAYVTDYARENSTFRGEQVREWAHRYAVPPLDLPPDLRAWGHVMIEAVKAGTITRDGYEATNVRPAHTTVRTRWRSNITHAEAPRAAPAPDKVVYHLSIGEGRVACGLHRRMRSAAAKAALIPAETKAGVSCLRCKGTEAYERAR